jgi:hypothetical protein
MQQTEFPSALAKLPSKTIQAALVHSNEALPSQEFPLG